MAANYFSFSLSGITIAITTDGGDITFVKQDSIPRLRAEPPSIERSAYNTPVKYGGFLPEPHIWTLKFMAPLEMHSVIQAMYDVHNDLFPKKQAAAIRVIDAYQVFSELGTRTRATAPTPFNAVTIDAYNLTKYFAQFDVWFSKQPSFVPDGAKVIVDLAFEEYKVVPA